MDFPSTSATPNHALQRTRRERRGCNRSVPCAGRLSLVISGITRRTYTTMKIDELKGCFEKTSGLFYFARMCSKIRLHAQGKLPEDYHPMVGQGFDGRTCRYLRVRYEDVRAQVLSGKSDAEVLDWCFAHGRRLTDEEVLIYN